MCTSVQSTAGKPAFCSLSTIEKSVPAISTASARSRVMSVRARSRKCIDLLRCAALINDVHICLMNLVDFFCSGHDDINTESAEHPAFDGEPGAEQRDRLRPPARISASTSDTMSMSGNGDIADNSAAQICGVMATIAVIWAPPAARVETKPVR